MNKKKVAKFGIIHDSRTIAEGMNAKANLGDRIREIVFSEIEEMVGVGAERMVPVDWNEIRTYRGEQAIFPYIHAFCLVDAERFLPFSDRLDPLFLCLVLQEDLFLGRDDLVRYFAACAPIGCRDEYTRNILLKYGIEAYLVGCFCMAMQPRGKTPERKGKTFLVDCSEKALAAIPDALKENAEVRNHSVPIQWAEDGRMHEEDLRNRAKALIEEYQNEANLVITSRMHAAIPALTAGIPVVLMCDNLDRRFEWLDKWIPLYQADDYAGIDWDPPAHDTSWIREKILELYRRAFNGEDRRAVMQELDRFYMARKRAVYFKTFRDRLAKISDLANRSDFSYVIWGAGVHCGYVFDLMREMYPNGRLTAIVDRYKTGERYGVPIIHADGLEEKKYDVVLISTHGGTGDAVEYLQNRFGPSCEDKYVIVCSQQES